MTGRKLLNHTDIELRLNDSESPNPTKGPDLELFSPTKQPEDLKEELDPKQFCEDIDLYFRQVSYLINLEQLYNPLDTCYYNNQMQYMPVLFEINSRIVFPKDASEQNKIYQLQIWETKTQKLIGTVDLSSIKNKVQRQQEEQESGQYASSIFSILWKMMSEGIIVQISNNNSISFILLKNSECYNRLFRIYQQTSNKVIKFYFQTYTVTNFAITDQHLVFSNNKCFWIFKKNQDIKLGKKNIDFAEVKHEKFDVGIQLDILRIFMKNDENSQKQIMVIFKGNSSRIDFNQMILHKNPDDQGNFLEKFQQQGDVHSFSQKQKSDSIDELKVVIKSDIVYVLAFIKKSGVVDFYTDMVFRKRLYGHQQEGDKFIIKKYNYTNIGMSMRAFYLFAENGTYFELKHKGSKNLQFKDLVKAEDTEFTPDKLIQKIVQDYIDLYKGFCIVNMDKNFYCVIAHRKILSVYSIFQDKFVKHIKFPADIEKIFEQQHYEQEDKGKKKYVSVLLKNFDFYDDISNLLKKQDEDEEAPKSTVNIKPFFGNEIKDLQFLRICGSQLNQTEIQIIYSTNQIIIVHEGEINDKLGYDEKSSPMIIRLNVVDTFKDFNNDPQIIITSEKKFTLYLLKFDSSTKKLKLVKKKDIYRNENYGPQDCMVSLDLDTNLIIMNRDEVRRLDKAGNIHAANSNKCVGSVFIDKSFNYFLCQESDDSKSHGLFMLDVAKYTDQKELAYLQLYQVDLCKNPHLKIFHQFHRIGFMESFSQYVIHPYLHSNSIKFMGVDSFGKAIFSKQIDQNFIRVNQEGYIGSWNILTGKFITDGQVGIYEKSDLGQYVNYERTNDNFIVCYYQPTDAESEPEMNPKQYEQFYVESQFKASILKQHASIKGFQGHDRIKQWKLIDIKDVNNYEIKYFEFPFINQKGMLFNNDMSRLICIIDEMKVNIYKGQPEGFDSIKWTVLRKITDFPFYFQFKPDDFKCNYLSPCFKYYLKYKSSKNEINIKYLETNKTLCRIESEVIYVKDSQKIRDDIKNFQWIDTEKFYYINHDKLEKIYQIKHDQKSQRYDFIEIAYNVEPFNNNIGVGDTELDIKDFSLFNNSFGTGQNIYNALRESYIRYKSHYFLIQDSFQQRYQRYFWTNKNENDTCQYQTFTFLYWAITNNLRDDKVEAHDIADDVFKSLIYNILPKGTILHYLDGQVDSMVDIFNRCHTTEEIYYHLPFISNIDNLDPFTLVKNQEGDLKQMYQVLKDLKHYSIDHHSRNIKDQYQLILQSKQLAALEYFESRFIQTAELQQIKTGNILKEEIVSNPGLRDTVKDKIVSDPGTKVSIKLEFLDLPGIYHFRSDNFPKFFEQLKETEGYDFFNNRAIQTIIDFNYKYVRTALMIWQIAPFFTFHVIFVAYMNIVYEKRIEDEYYVANIVLGAIQLAFSVYFLAYEIRQIKNLGFSYIQSFWNYIDLLAPAGVIILHGFQFAEFAGDDQNIHLVRCILSIATLIMWMKFISSFRNFQSTNYLIRMVYEVVYDMRIFLLVLALTVAGFGDAFLRISDGNEEDDQFIDSFVPAVLYAYSMILGGYDTEGFGEIAVPLVWILWILCTILGMIVMLNLLIAIISGTHDKVIDNQTGASYKEMAEIIAENSYLVQSKIRRNYCEKDKMLLVQTNLQIKNEQFDKQAQQFEDLKDEIQYLRGTFDEKTKKIEEKEEKIHKDQEEGFLKTTKVLGELKFYYIKAQKLKEGEVSDEIEVDIAPGVKLSKMFLIEIQQLKYKDNDYEQWQCYAKKFTGCKLEDQLTFEPDEVIFRCEECDFNYCQGCNDAYPDSHEHPLKKITFKEIQDSTGVNYWYCDGNYWEPCERDQEQENNDLYEQLYHKKLKDGDYRQVDLCLDCAERCKIDDDSDYGDEDDESGENADKKEEDKTENDQNQESGSDHILKSEGNDTSQRSPSAPLSKQSSIIKKKFQKKLQQKLILQKFDGDQEVDAE